MRDKRPVDELSIVELERILAIRRREERQKRLQRFKSDGRVVGGEVDPVSRSAPIAKTRQPETAVIPSATLVLDHQAVSLSERSPTPSFEDDGEAPMTETNSRLWKTFTNRALLFVEVIAVGGLIWLGVNLMVTANNLQRESALAQAMANEQRLAGLPTLAPTSVIELVGLESFVLPGGHIIDANGVAQFNFDEFISDVPSHLLSTVQRQAYFPIDITRPAPTDQTPLQLIIPQLNIDQSIVQGTDWEALKLGVGQVLNGAVPSDPTGNVVFAAHNDIYGELFRDLDQLVVGDEFQVQTRTQTYTYRVFDTLIVNPTDIYVMQEQDRAIVTLISCYPYGVNNKRYIVFAERVDL
ncbi:MAG: class D sortase [Anaerolineae bacterium]|jgi:sortase A|nr:class D sortase [Anaerolineae bacterium]